MNIPESKADWPKKWVTCKQCGCDWRCTGYPAGKQTKFTDQIRCHQLVDKNGIIWVWPTVCQPCADYWEAKPRPKPKEEQPKRAHKGAYQD